MSERAPLYREKIRAAIRTRYWQHAFDDLCAWEDDMLAWSNDLATRAERAEEALREIVELSPGALARRYSPRWGQNYLLITPFEAARKAAIAALAPATDTAETPSDTRLAPRGKGTA